MAPLLQGHIKECSILFHCIPLASFAGFYHPLSITPPLERYPHITVTLAEAMGADVSRAPRGGGGEILIRFAGPAGTIVPVPYYQVFDGSWRQTLGADFFRGKAVVIGLMNPLQDRAITPVGEMQGVETFWYRRLRP